MCRSSGHLVKPFEKYALSEMTSSVSHLNVIALPETQCFVVPPHGQDDLQDLQSIFEVDHLRDSYGVTFLDTQCEYHISTRRAWLVNLALY